MLEVRVLGDVKVTRDGTSVPVPHGLVRSVLLSLVANFDRVVSDDVLSHRLWGDDAPRTAAYSLRNAVSRLREVVGEAAVVRSAGGYRLVSTEVRLDVTEFEELLARGRALMSSDARAALVDLDSALALVRGAPYAEVRDQEWALALARGADDLIAVAEEAWTDARLAAGDVGADLWRIRSFATSLPMRERRWCQLVDALVLDARRAEALRAVQDARAALAEFGLMPGPELIAAERHALGADEGEQPLDTNEACEARIRAAISLQRAGVFTEARALLAEAAALAESQGGRRSAARVMVEQARLCMLSGEGDPRGLLEQARNVGRELRDGSLLATTALVGFAAGLSPEKGNALVELLEPLPLLAPAAPESVDLLCAAAVTVAFADASPAARQLLTEAGIVHARQGTDRSEALLSVAQAMVDAVDGRDHAVVAASATKALRLATAAHDHALVVLASMASLRAAYHVGDIEAVDRMLPGLEEASRMAMLPFGTMRVALCRTTNAIARGELAAAADLVVQEYELGTRLRVLVTDGAVRTHRFILAREADLMADLIPVARLAQAARPAPNAWNAVLANAGDEDFIHTLADVAPEVSPDDTYDVFLSMAAEVAARRLDTRLGRWCVDQLAPFADRTLMTGIGTGVLGFASHYCGLAWVGAGDALSLIHI